jgi:hypothetical protein
MSQPTSGAPAVIAPPRQEKGSGLAVAAFVVAIVALLLCLVPIVNNGAFFLALVGLGLGIPAYLGGRKGKRHGKGLALAAVILSVVSMVGVIASQSFYGNVLDKASESLDTSLGGNTDKVLAEYVTVKPGKFSYKKDQFGIEETALPVRITNKSGKVMSFDVTVEALDSSGARIGDDTVYVNALAPGKTANGVIFQLTNNGAQLAKATFKVSKAGATEQ